MAWADDNYEHKKLITINKDKVAGDETDFPVLISITDSDLTGCLANGYDIKFYNEAEDTQLKHERESWDNSTGAFVAWLKIPSLSSTSDTLVYMYYEYASESLDQADPENVWDSHFKVVQHLNESSGTLYDSTSNSNDGTNNDAVYNSAARINGGYDFDSGNSANISTSYATNISSWTIETWVRSPDAPSTAGGSSGVVHREKNYQINWDHPSAAYAGATALLTAVTWYPASFGTLNANTWYYLVGTFNNSNLIAYKDGTEETNNADPDDPPSSEDDNLAIGKCSPAGATYFDGNIDEVRISDSTRSANWISTTYETQNDPDAFMSWGNQKRKEPVPTENVNIYR